MPDKPPAGRAVSLIKYAAMLAITIVCGVVFAILGGLLYAAVATGDDVGFASLGNFLLGAIAGYALGLIFGVWLAGRLTRRPGTSWQATFGAVIGIVLIMLLAEPLSLNTNQDLLVSLLLFVPALFAVIGHQLKINWRRKNA
jgi:hypothetical protein